MKKILLIILFPIVAVLLCILLFNDPYMSQAEKHAKSILGRTAKIIEKKYGLQPSGSGLAMPGGNLKEFMLSFDTKKEFTKEEIRMLLIECANEMLEQINTDQEIRIAMVTYPFTEKNVDLIIYNYDQNRRTPGDPQIATARLSGGTLKYHTVEKGTVYPYINTDSETYQQALQAIQQ